MTNTSGKKKEQGTQSQRQRQSTSVNPDDDKRNTKPPEQGLARFIENCDGLAVALCLFPVGGRHDPVGKEGLCHLVEHMCFTRHKTFFDHLSKRSVNAASNAMTHPDYTFFYVYGPAENWKPILEALRNLAFHTDRDIADIEENEFKREHQVVIEEFHQTAGQKSGGGDVSDLLFDDMKTVRGNYARPVIGTIESLMNITQKDAVEFYSNRMITSDFQIAINIDTEHREDVEKYIENCNDWKNIAALREKNRGCDGFTRENVSVNRNNNSKEDKIRKLMHEILLPWKSRMKVIITPSGMNHVAIGFPSVPMSHKHSRAMDIIGFCLGGGFTSIMYRMLRTTLPVVYNVQVSNLSMSEEGFFLSKYSTSFPIRGAIIKLVLEAMTRLPELVSEKDFSLYKRRYITNVRIQNTTAMEHTKNTAKLMVEQSGVCGDSIPPEQTMPNNRYDDVTYEEFLCVCKEHLNMSKVYVYASLSEDALMSYKTVLTQQ